MAVTTFTRRQIVADMFPEFGTKRSRALAPHAEGYARELGISPLALAHLANAPALESDGGVTRAVYRFRSPYAVKEPYAAAWDELVAAGLAEPAPAGWRPTERGLAAGMENHRRFRVFTAGLPVPVEATRSARGTSP